MSPMLYVHKNILKINRSAIEKFITIPNCKLLIFSWAKGEELVSSNAIPQLQNQKKKAMAFMKIVNSPITPQNYYNCVFVLEYTGNPLENLSVISKGAFFPLLKKEENRNQWVGPASRNLLFEFNHFLGDLCTLVGQSQGKTVLSFPPLDLYNKDVDGNEKLSTLEHFFRSWIRQISDAVSREPSLLFDNGNPDPLDELVFWKEKAEDLQSIFSQVESDSVQVALKHLEKDAANGAEYVQEFESLSADLHKKCYEATSNVSYLKSMEKEFALLRDALDFVALKSTFPIIMYKMLLIWKCSDTYNTTGRLQILVKEINNSVIGQACKFVTGEEIFRLIEDDNADEAIGKIKDTIAVCQSLQTCFLDYRSKVRTELSPEKSEVSNKVFYVMFSRAKTYLERCGDIVEFTTLVQQFSKLDRIFIGGTKGKELTEQVRDIYDSFLQSKEKLKNVSYDIMDIRALEFDADFFRFRGHIKELERRLALILATGFDDLTTIRARFQLLDGFESLLKRPMLKDEFYHKKVELIKEFVQEMRAMQKQFNDACKDPPVTKNMPPFYGAVAWARGYRTRIEPQMQKLRQVIFGEDSVPENPELWNKHVIDHDSKSNNNEVIITPEGKMSECEHIFEIFMNQLQTFESQQISKWQEEINSTSEESLKKCILQRDNDSQLIKINLDVMLVKLFRESQYFLSNEFKVPEKSANIFEKHEQFKTWSCKLELILSMYNAIINNLHTEERPLFQKYLDDIDQTLMPGLNDINWKSRGIEEFIAAAQHKIGKVYTVFEILKNNLKKIMHKVQGVQKKNIQAKILTLLHEFGEVPLCERKNKPIAADEFAENLEKVQKQRFGVLQETNTKIGVLGEEIQKVLGIAAGDPKWLSYVDYVHKQILGELIAIIHNSINWFVRQVDHSAQEDEIPALIEIQLCLLGTEIQFSTLTNTKSKVYVKYLKFCCKQKKKKSDHKTLTTLKNERIQKISRTQNVEMAKDVWSRMSEWVKSCLKVGEMVYKINGSKTTFEQDLGNDATIQESLQVFGQWLKQNKEECEKYREQFYAFDHLYKQDRNRALKEFLASDEKISDELSRVCHAKSNETKETTVPSLEKFQERILFYNKIHDEISSKPTPITISWLKVDSQPLKQALQTWVSKWSHTYTSFLKENLINKINHLYEFMDNVTESLKREVQKGDLDGLKFILNIIHQVKSREESTKSMFSPLDESIKYSWICVVFVCAGVVEKLKDAPLRWEATVNKVYLVKEKVNPLQNEQVDNIKQKLWEFRDEIVAFGQDFRDNAPFQYESGIEMIHAAYQKMLFYHKAIGEKENKANELNQLENLFELTPPSKYRQLAQCRQENKLLKNLWDLIALVHHLFESWRCTRWNDIDTEQLLNEVSKLNKRINGMDKEIRGWKAFQGLQDEVRRYQTVLPLINLLHSPTMKDRHWKMLMDVTKTVFTMSSEFSLGDMLDLGLHNHVDGVEEVVEISDKEAKIEMQINKLRGLWAGADAQKFEYTVHEQTNVPQIKIPEEVLVNLEESMSMLQGIKGQGKYVQHFLQEVNMWENRLGMTETVISDWLLVQTKWSSLQSIFIGSEDIREQLPEDSERFTRINQTWRDLMNVAKNTPQVVETCNFEGRSQLLEVLKKDLELCEKSLNQYLETKKMAFPRFYFLSNVALLDLLSNGNNPQRVQVHMGDCFDNIKSLEFAKDSKGNPTKDAIGMYSKEGEEYVPFYKPYSCEGAVEDWLNGLVEMMRQTLRELLGKAKFTADQWELEKPRHEWLYDYCAQLALTASQIIWTEETEAHFQALEDGNEAALREFSKVCEKRLEDLIKLVSGDLTKRDRIKIMTLITVDVHNRDVIKKLIEDKIQSPGEFAWQAQMRYGWDPETLDCFVLVADWKGRYAFEYIGNTGRLVITPLTDRCYITLTQALKLIMGGAPAGPAGTGKTETTKDLGRAIGLPVYVFNCSEQMNVISLGNIFKGLCQTGAWGCFDEFNRIPIEVLSVVATQMSSFLNALRAKKTSFDLMGTTIKLVDTVGVFITMNPGYAGRTELPENLKALFRSCAMVVPDMELICENMLMSEGFLNAKPLAHKFITLYGLSRELLSQQKHYDWGLRATKAVLRVAGGLKRAEPQVDEARILMRALRDFNLPKIVFQDQRIFLRLIDDLFRGLEINRKVSQDLNEAIVKVTKQSGLQAEDMFVRKVTELAELFDVRHSVFVIGNAGSGKSEVWKVLAKAYNELGKKTVYETINPKAVKNDELCENGYTQSQVYKWLVLDGDIDPEWIESLNTVMDDNKVLTLVSNERIPLTAAMRLLFEVSHLKNATPATVSRAGILYLNPNDIGWKPMTDSWLDHREEDSERYSFFPLEGGVLFLFCFNYSFVSILFYITSEVLDHIRKNFMTIVPVSDIQKLQTLCFLLEGVLPSIRAEINKSGNANEASIYEKHFIYAAIWAFGGCLLVDETNNFKLEYSFSNFFLNCDFIAETLELQAIQYPADQDVQGTNTIFDYYFDETKNDIVRWETRVTPYQASPGRLLLNSIMVETVDTVRTLHYLNLLIKMQRPALYVGTSGTGKTVIVRGYLRNLPEDFISTRINLNSYTDATSLRCVMQQHLDKRSGRNYGPPGGKKLIYFVDDLNMPYVDNYGTQSPIALIRQHMDYSLWYDTDESDPNRKKKFIRDTQYIAAMNHKAGSFTVNTQVMGHFAVFAMNTPGKEQLISIYKSILDGHLVVFDQDIQKLSQSITNATIDLLETISRSSKFRPSSTKFHYQFNLRDISNVFQGLVTSKPDTLTGIDFVRLWYHECTRVFADRLIDQADVESFESTISELSKKHFSDMDQAKVQMQPLIFTPFVKDENKASEDGAYIPCPTYEKLNKTLEAYLTDYNENNPQMGLVLFEMAMNHVVRIARIISQSGGNALLVGVGGSGKQSLTRLASWICSYEVFQIQLTRTYGVNDLLENVRSLYMKAGVKGQGVTFLLTDSQIMDEKWLVYINDLLSSGDIPQLFAEEEKDSIYTSLRNEAKQAGVQQDNRSQMHDYFISRVQQNLHMVLCMSPVGEAFRVRCRKFPALINCTVMDWFFSWPKDALCSVAERFLDSEGYLLFSLQEIMTQQLRSNIAHHMAEVHLSVNNASTQYFQVEKRYNYTTPKSFLELIDFYKALFKKESDKLYQQIQRLDKGIATLQKTAKDVASLQDDLREKLKIVEEKKKTANALIERCGKEKLKVDDEKKVAEHEEQKASVVLEKANKLVLHQKNIICKSLFQRNNFKKFIQCDIALKKAMPALESAKKAVDCLTKASLTELKALKTPDPKILSVTKAVLILKEHEKKDHTWKRAQAMMKNVDQFKRELENFNANEIDEEILKLCQPILALDYFNAESMTKISQAAANLATWIVATVQYNEIYKNVAPKIAASNEASSQHAEAMAVLQKVREQVAAKEAELKKVTDELQQAIDEKNRVEADAEACQARLALAERLVNGLADENQRWGVGVSTLQNKQHTLVGDVLLSAAFVSYIGAFNQKFRKHLWENCWLKDLVERQIPLSQSIVSKELLPKDVLATSPQQATWANEGLPVDSISIENAAIVTLCSRWPLLIDPQQQGVKWIRSREQDLKVVNLNHPRWLSVIVRAVEQGHTVLLENVSENIDPTLDPVLSRAIIRKGRNTRIRIAGEEKDYDPKFRLYLQTKLANPHYKPEIFAQCTLINFIVTEQGLEEQLLALVVNDEKPDLEETKRSLMRRLEMTKKASKEIVEKVAQAKQKEIEINVARNQYRPVAEEASWLYFLLIQMNTIDHMYQYSLDAFITFFYKAMRKAEKSDDVQQRVKTLRNEIRVFLIFGQRKYETPNAIPWLSDAAWNGLCKLSDLEGLERFVKDLVASANRFKEWFLKPQPEASPLPLDWRKLDENDPVAKLCIVRCMRPDRMTSAMEQFVREMLPNGRSYTELDAGKSFQEVLLLSMDDADNKTPIFFILSPGADPVQTVYQVASGKYHRVAMGQGQDIIAMKKLKIASEEGHWIVLENIHLMPRWCKELQKTLDELEQTSHKEFRFFYQLNQTITFQLEFWKEVSN
ncbi:hypothetical protein RFI_10483 [Reticulomyxa filosa]|uniref:AAA+ ATPase domain-containing protein n=1 Tax=Reticulomyxa filosa TaxID=46433 RepID=X6NL61_RETFI|nr:hypothetical protein RFI_10483 [Reticulomyxa filosa]|eukprot:ETO26653.1 hypothetical protein RFI_10483 [Reticulomyxa filosa]